MAEIFKYFAFISYNRRNIVWGKRLQRKLENYKMPTTLCSERGWERNPLKPIFFAPTDIQPNDLTEELKARLRASRNLIVICSPNSAKSEWVGKEIAYFHSLGRGANIFFFIIDGIPNSGDPATECYHEVVRELGLQDVLGANINEPIFKSRYLNRERAYVQLITKLLGIEFDDIWKRHKRQLIEKLLLFATVIVAVITIVVWALMVHRPIDIRVSLKEMTPQNVSIPQLTDAEVTLCVSDYVRSARVHSIDQVIVFSKMPHSLLGSSAKLRFVDFPETPEAMNYYPQEVETTLTEHMELPVRRDTVKYGHIRARIMNARYQPRRNYTTTIAGMTVKTDNSGYVDVQIPFHKQTYSYIVEQDTISNVGVCSLFAVIVE